MTNTKKILIAVALAWPFLATAESLSLEQAYQKAQQFDATLRAASAENRAQKEEIEKAWAGFLPKASASLYDGRASTDSQTPGFLGKTNQQHSVYDSRNYSFSVRQPIYNKANFVQYAESKAVVAKSDAVLAGERLNLILRVTSAYLDVMLSLETLNYTQMQKISVQSQLEQAEKRFKAGVGTITEISEAKANLESVIAKYLEAENAFEYSKRALENTVGIYGTDFLILDANKLPLSALNPSNAEDWIVAAFATNPEIVALQNDVLVATQEIEKNQSGHYPTLDLTASRAHTQSDSNYTIGSTYDTDSIGLQLSIPIYSGGYVSASVRQSLAKLEQAQEVLSAKQRDIAIKVRKAFNDVVNGAERTRALQLAVSFNEIALTGTQKGFNAGTRTNVEVLTAQEKLYSAKRDLAKERYQYIYNKVLLKQLNGSLAESDINEINSWLTSKLN